MSAESCIIENVFYGAKYYLSRDGAGWEWVLERERACVFADGDYAEALCNSHGGHRVLLNQKRVSAGTIGRSNDRGPRT